MKWLRKKKPYPRKCENCSGVGHVTPISTCFGPIEIPCAECQGKGKIKPYALAKKKETKTP